MGYDIEKQKDITSPILINIDNIINIIRMPHSNGYEIVVDVILEREINDVDYIFCVIANYMTIFAKDILPDNYLMIDGDHYKNIFNAVLCNEHELLPDILNTTKSRRINIKNNNIWGIDIDYCLTGYNYNKSSNTYFNTENQHKTILSYNDYCTGLIDVINRYIPHDKLDNVNIRDIIDFLKVDVNFAIENTFDILNIDKYTNKAILYLLQVLYIDKVFKTTYHIKSLCGKLKKEDANGLCI